MSKFMFVAVVILLFAFAYRSGVWSEVSDSKSQIPPVDNTTVSNQTESRVDLSSRGGGGGGHTISQTPEPEPILINATPEWCNSAVQLQCGLMGGDYLCDSHGIGCYNLTIDITMCNSTQIQSVQGYCQGWNWVCSESEVSCTN